jgi:hypothetical protein
MKMTELKVPVIPSIRQDPGPLCPACGGVMTETDRLTENGTTYIWFACRQRECDGQWLDKRPARAG